jgi:hypothetical protein
VSRGPRREKALAPAAPVEPAPANAAAANLRCMYAGLEVHLAEANLAPHDACSILERQHRRALLELRACCASYGPLSDAEQLAADRRDMSIPGRAMLAGGWA